MLIKWTKEAEKDLDNVEKYIFQDNPIAAIDTVLLIMQTVEKLLPESPSIGRAGRVLNTRELIIPNYPYIIPYRVKDGVIEVLRVIHMSRQWPDNL